MNTWVPPLYSLFMIPAFLIKNDVRMFYFVNVLLAITSLIFFYLNLRHMTDGIAIKNSNKLLSLWKQQFTLQNLIVFTTLFLYVTNYFNYWYPTLAMGENLVIPLFLASLWLFTKKTGLKSIVAISLLSIAIYATKTANLPIMAALVAGYGIKLLTEEQKKEKWRLLGQFAGTFIVMFIAFSLYFQVRYGSSILSTLFFFLSNLFPTKIISPNGGQAVSGGWFSLEFMKTNLPKYARAMLGGYSVRFLWDNTPIVPLCVGTVGLAGIAITWFNKRFRSIGITLALVMTGSIVFMSTFYSVDMRYLYQSIAILHIGFAMFWTQVSRIGNKKTVQFAAALSIAGMFVFYSLTNIVRLKNQTMLNLKYSETPWYYLSVLKLNEYFDTLPAADKKPIVISAMIPYYIDFYSNGKYDLLPLSLTQEFRDHREKAWGKDDYSNLLKLYDSYLDRGYEVYVNNYGIGNEKPLQTDFQKIMEVYSTKIVSEGCYNACNTWKLYKK